MKQEMQRRREIRIEVFGPMGEPVSIPCGGFAIDVVSGRRQCRMHIDGAGMVVNVSQASASLEPAIKVMTLQCDIDGQYSVIGSRLLLDS
jgi:hypothetical protein